MSAPEKIWHAIDRKGKISGAPDAHVKPCADAIDAYEEYTHRAALDAMLAKAREDALREAASVCRDNAPRIEHDSTQDDRMHEAILERAARHIEALIPTAEGES